MKFQLQEAYHKTEALQTTYLFFSSYFTFRHKKKAVFSDSLFKILFTNLFNHKGNR